MHHLRLNNKLKMKALLRFLLLCYATISPLLVSAQHRMPQDSWYLDREIQIPSLPGLYHPRSIDISESGDVYVAEWQSHRVSIWDESGNFQGSFGRYGGAEGEFQHPSCIYVSGIEIYVGSWQSHEIQVFNLGGEFLRGWGSHGNGEGQFYHPDGIWVDDNATNGKEVYIADRYNHRVQVFDENGTFLRKFGTSGSGDGQLSEVCGVGVGPDGMVYASSKNNQKIQVFTKDGNFSRSFPTTGGSPFQMDFYQNKLAVGLGDQHRVEIFDLNGTSLGYFGSGGAAIGQLNNPFSLAFDSSGSLLVCESNNHRIQKFDTNGTSLSKFGFYGNANYNPYGLAKTEEETFLITDIGGHRVVEIDQNGTLIRVIASEGDGEGLVYYPRDVHLGSDGRIYVCDTNRHRVQVFDRNGSFIRMIGTNGSANGQFNQPWASVTSQSELFVLDRYNHRIQVFDLNGTYLRSFGGLGNLEGKFNNPMDMDWDDEGNLIILDHSNRRVVHMTPEGEFVRQYNTPNNEYFLCNLDNGLLLLTRHYFWGVYDLQGHLLKQGEYNMGEAKVAALEDGGFARIERGRNVIKIFRSTFRNVRLDDEDGIPLPEVLSVLQRDGTNLLDITYRINDANGSKVRAAMLGFVDGGNDLSKIIVPQSFNGGITGKLDNNVSTNQEHTVSWNVGDDWDVGFGELQVEILAKDDRNLLDLHFLSLPVGGDGNASNLIINRSPLYDADFLSVWYWLLATGEPEIELIGSSIVPVLVDGQAPSFQPSDPGNLLAWLDANNLDGNSSSTADGTIVTQWSNRANGESPFTQTNTSKQPVLHTNVLNNKAGVFFDDIDDGMESTIQINANPYTVAVLFNCLNTSGAGRRAVQGSHNWLIGPYGNRVGYHPNGWASYNRVSLVADKFYLAVGITTDQESRFYVNGKDETENTSPKYWPGTLYLGASGSSPGEKLNGYICEMLAYDKALSSTELTDLNEYFSYKWGIRQSYADGSSTTLAGRSYLLDKMNLREATVEEVQRAREGAIPGSVNQFTPSFQVGPKERPKQVNEYGFDTYTTNGVWVVPVPTNP